MEYLHCLAGDRYGTSKYITVDMDRRTHAVLLTKQEDLASARALVRRQYVKAGYYTSEDGDSRLEQFLKLPGAATFGLFTGAVLYGSISVVTDSDHGLPMDALYADDLAHFRVAGRRLAEVTQFSIDHELVHKKLTGTQALFAAAPLFAAVLGHADRNGIEYLCISINPKHEFFYELLGFSELGGLKHYPAVNAPAIGKILAVEEFKGGAIVQSIMRKEILKYLSDDGR